MGGWFKKVARNVEDAVSDPERVLKAVATGGISEMVEGTKKGFEIAQKGYNEASGLNAAEEAQERALAGLEGDIAQARAMSDVSMEEQLGILGDTFNQQKGINSRNYRDQGGLLRDTYSQQMGTLGRTNRQQLGTLGNTFNQQSGILNDAFNNQRGQIRCLQ